MPPIIRTRLFAVVAQLYAITGLVAVAERLGYGLISPPVAVAVGFLVGLGNVLFWVWSGRRAVSLRTTD